MSDFWRRWYRSAGLPFYVPVASGKIAGTKHIHQVGHNPDIDAAEDIWSYGGTYTYSASAVTHYCSSSNNGDTQDLLVWGLDANWNYQEKTVTLTGQTKKEIDGTWIRINGAYNADTTVLAGDGYIFEDDTLTAGVPDTATKVRAKIDTTCQASLSSHYAIPAGKSLYITNMYVNGNRGAAAAAISASICLQQRDFGKIFRVLHTVSWHSYGGPVDHSTFPICVPAKSDIKLRCTATSAVDLDLTASFDGILIEDE